MLMESIVNKICEVFHVSSNCLQIDKDGDITLNAEDYTVYVSVNYVSISATNAILKANPQLMTKVNIIQSFISWVPEKVLFLMKESVPSLII